MKEIIISIYDGGYWWSIRIDGKTWTRTDNSIYPYPYAPTKRISNLYQKFKDSHELFPKFLKRRFDRIIICEDGSIDIWEKRK